ncbi:hypothetical protein BLNAU_7825 [Blattamonas nauphoetae]|uniref:ubiquitinyl hydrolase 1 n=1 Tax=Blattamonas nauphoetae TaxID=2049346 RepID=A0ABQ9Y0H1_9EUKA|nr:hypothetical protein BLNAU_7825 [Blattamonas nauphoetae]
MFGMQLNFTPQPLHCHSCQRSYNGLYICLDCVFIGCHNACAHQHFHQTSHHLFISASSGSLACFQCRALGNCSIVPALPFDRCSQYTLVPWSLPASFLSLHTRPSPKNLLIRGIRGLLNLGKTSYANSVLQCLVQSPILSRLLLGSTGAVHIPRHQLTTSPCSICEFERILSEFSTKTDRIESDKPDLSSSYPTINPSRFVYTVWTQPGSHFTPGQEHDPYEYLLAVMKLLHSHIHFVQDNTETESTKKDAHQPRPNALFRALYPQETPHEIPKEELPPQKDCSCFIHRIFGIKTLKSTLCTHCNTLNTSTSSQLTLSLSLPSLLSDLSPSTHSKLVHQDSLLFTNTSAQPSRSHSPKAFFHPTSTRLSNWTPATPTASSTSITRPQQTKGKGSDSGHHHDSQLSRVDKVKLQTKSQESTSPSLFVEADSDMPYREKDSDNEFDKSINKIKRKKSIQPTKPVPSPQYSLQSSFYPNQLDPARSLSPSAYPATNINRQSSLSPTSTNFIEFTPRDTPGTAPTFFPSSNTTSPSSGFVASTLSDLPTSPSSRPSFQYLVPSHPPLSPSDKESHPQQHSTIRSGFPTSPSQPLINLPFSPSSEPSLTNFSPIAGLSGLHLSQIRLPPSVNQKGSIPTTSVLPHLPTVTGSSLSTQTPQRHLSLTYSPSSLPISSLSQQATPDLHNILTPRAKTDTSTFSLDSPQIEIGEDEMRDEDGQWVPQAGGLAGGNPQFDEDAGASESGQESDGSSDSVESEQLDGSAASDDSNSDADVSEAGGESSDEAENDQDEQESASSSSTNTSNAESDEDEEGMQKDEPESSEESSIRRKPRKSKKDTEEQTSLESPSPTIPTAPTPLTTTGMQLDLIPYSTDSPSLKGDEGKGLFVDQPDEEFRMMDDEEAFTMLHQQQSSLLEKFQFETFSSFFNAFFKQSQEVFDKEKQRHPLLPPTFLTPSTSSSPSSNTLTLETLLAHFFSIKTSDAACPNCHQTGQVTSQRLLSQIPHTLVINIDRTGKQKGEEQAEERDVKAEESAIKKEPAKVEQTAEQAASSNTSPHTSNHHSSQSHVLTLPSFLSIPAPISADPSVPSPVSLIDDSFFVATSNNTTPSLPTLTSVTPPSTHTSISPHSKDYSSVAVSFPSSSLSLLPFVACTKDAAAMWAECLQRAEMETVLEEREGLFDPSQHDRVEYITRVANNHFSSRFLFDLGAVVCQLEETAVDDVRYVTFLRLDIDTSHLPPAPSSDPTPPTTLVPIPPAITSEFLASLVPLFSPSSTTGVSTIWIRALDESLSFCSFDAIDQKDALLLFYQKRNLEVVPMADPNPVPVSKSTLDSLFLCSQLSQVVDIQSVFFPPPMDAMPGRDEIQLEVEQ